MPTSIFAFGKACVSVKDKGGETFTLSPLGFREIAEYVLAYKFKEVEEAEYAIINFPPDLRKIKLDEAYERCLSKRYIYTDENSGEEKSSELSWETLEVQESCNTIWGIERQLYLSLRIKHPKITKEKVSEIVTLHSYDAIFKKVMVATGFFSEEEKNGGDDDEDLGIEIDNL